MMGRRRVVLGLPRLLVSWDVSNGATIDFILL